MSDQYLHVHAGLGEDGILMATELTAALEGLDNVAVLLDEPLAKHTSLGVGGPADLFVVPRSIEALQSAVKLAATYDVPMHVLGEGTNLVVRDGGIRGMVLKMGRNLAQVRHDGNQVVAQAGARLALLCRKCCEWGLSGLEFASGIPGSIGGALVMNAGAYDGEMAHVVEWVMAIDRSGEKLKLHRDELGMSYRRSVFQDNGMLIACAAFLLTPCDHRVIRSRIYSVVEERCGKQPVARRSAGSIFKRPEGDYAGRMLEEVGAKGMRVGGAMISEKHANFIVNHDHATATDVLALIAHVRQRVHDRFGVWLQTEVVTVGDDRKP
jgi:UDP-N-acetylmuramate dehydrogenase